jgi:hypothetical protein
MRTRNEDAQLAERALRLGWDVPEEKRPALVNTLIELVHNPDTGPREKVSAF